MQIIKFANPIPTKYTTVVILKTQINTSHAEHIFPVRKMNPQVMLKAVTSTQQLRFQKAQNIEEKAS
jgi:hypothetical protein